MFKKYKNIITLVLTASIIGAGMLFFNAHRTVRPITLRQTADVLSSGTGAPIIPSPLSVQAATSSTSAAAQPQPLASGLVPTVQAASVPSAPASDQTDPVTLRIASISLVAPVVRTGLESSGALHVPSSPDQTGWYDLGPKPGDVGPAVITGHLDSALGPGVFYHLKNVKVGDEINVVRDDGSTAIFTVDKLAVYPQDDFNTQAVYGPTVVPALRLITCAGVYSKITKHYSDDLVVFATLKQISQPAAYQPGQYIGK